MGKEPIGLYLVKLILSVSMIVLLGALFGSIGWLAKNYQSKVVMPEFSPVPTPAETVSLANEVKDWKTYQNKGYKFQIKVPPAWKIGSWDIEPETISADATVVSRGFSLGKSITFNKPDYKGSMKITVSDKGNVEYDKNVYLNNPQFIETKPEKIVVGRGDGLSLFAEGTTYNYRISECGDDNKMKNGKGLCDHHKIIKLYRDKLYYTIDMSYMGETVLKIVENMVKTLEPLEYGPNAGIFMENNAVFNYPAYFGDYNKDTGKDSMFYYFKTEKDGVSYSFENGSGLDIIFENKDFTPKRNVLYGGTPLIDPDAVTNIDNYCEKNKKDLLSCKKVKINSNTNGIVEDKITCVASPTGGGIGCTYGRLFFTKTDSEDYPVFALNMMLWQTDASDPVYRECDYEYTQDLNKTKSCFKKNYNAYYGRYEKELSILDNIISSVKFIKKGEIPDWRTYKNESYELKYPGDWKHVGNSFFDGKYNYDDREKPGLTIGLKTEMFGNEKESRVFKKENAFKDNSNSKYQKITILLTNDHGDLTSVVCSFSDDISIIDTCNKIVSTLKFSDNIVIKALILELQSEFDTIDDMTDLNNDGKEEFVVINKDYDKGIYKLYVYTLIDLAGNHKEIGEIDVKTPMLVSEVRDVNGDGIKEIVLTEEARGGTAPREAYSLLSVDFKRSKISFIETKNAEGKNITTYESIGGVGGCSSDDWAFGKDLNGDGKKEMVSLHAVPNSSEICPYYNASESKDSCHMCDLTVYQWGGAGFTYDKSMPALDSSKIDPAELFERSGCNSCEWIIK